MGIKLYTKGLKMVLMNRLNVNMLSQHPRSGKVCDSTGLLFHKHKDGGAQ